MCRNRPRNVSTSPLVPIPPKVMRETARPFYLQQSFLHRSISFLFIYRPATRQLHAAVFGIFYLRRLPVLQKPPKNTKHAGKQAKQHATKAQAHLRQPWQKTQQTRAQKARPGPNRAEALILSVRGEHDQLPIVSFIECTRSSQSSNKGAPSPIKDLAEELEDVPLSEEDLAKDSEGEHEFFCLWGPTRGPCGMCGGCANRLKDGLWAKKLAALLGTPEEVERAFKHAASTQRIDVRAFVGCRFLRLWHGRYMANIGQADNSIQLRHSCVILLQFNS